MFQKIFRPLHSKKSPVLAFIIGLATGGLGLCLYFRSFVDFAFIIGFGLLNITALKKMGLPAQCVLAGCYGVVRVVISNDSLNESNNIQH